MSAPDLAGFAAAQGRLRQTLGVNAEFITGSAPTWPSGTPLDPETGRPYDPFLEPQVPGALTSTVVRCSFVSRPLASDDPAQSPLGAADRGSAALILTAAAYATVKTAKRVIVGAETYELQNWRQDIVAGMVRWIAYLEHA